MNPIDRIKEKWKEVDRWVSMRMKQKYGSETIEKAAEARLENLEEDEG